MPADRQRQRVYDAEQRVCDQLDFAARGASAAVVYGSTVTVSGDLRFGSLETAQAWLDHLRGRRWFADRWPAAAAAPLALRPRRGQRGAHYEPHRSGGAIAVPVPAGTTGWAMREIVLAHELAHHVVASDHGGAGRGGPAGALEPHGAVFTAVMLELVGEVLGPETRLLLSAAYHDGAVAVAAPAAPSGAGAGGASAPAARARPPSG